MREDIEPTVAHEDGPMEGDKYSHPAYGTIVLSHSQGGNQRLFGSDLVHNSQVSIQINTASLRRSLSNDWIYSGKRILELNMSFAQFASFISSSGDGCGTPITLRYCDGGEVPGIKKSESKHDMFRREIQESAKERLGQMDLEVKRLAALIDSGKTPRGELKDILRNLQRHVDQTPGSIGFVVEQAEEALEKATSDAKIDVESYIAMAAKKIGLNHINDLGKLVDKSTSDALEAFPHTCNYSRSMLQDYPRKCMVCGKQEPEAFNNGERF